MGCIGVRIIRCYVSLTCVQLQICETALEHIYVRLISMANSRTLSDQTRSYHIISSYISTSHTRLMMMMILHLFQPHQADQAASQLS